MKYATFAAGCFWGVEAAFRMVKGVIETQVGYTGGHLTNPNYKDVCTGTTSHAEAVLVEYDPDQVTYEELLELFWKIHDPTQLNMQWPDIGTQYRSVIFYHDEIQRQNALKSKKILEKNGKYHRPIVTLIEPAQKFYPAEEYHQKYFEKKGIKHGGCHSF